MNRPTSLPAACLLLATMFAGCGAPETPVTGAAPVNGPPPTSSPDDAAATQRARIARMYEDYRAKAFASVDELTVAEVPVGTDDQSLLLVDCREDRERVVSMIEGAVSKADFEADAERYRDRLIVTYCTIGYRSGIYAQTLEDRGFRTRNLVGGVLAWAHEGRPFIGADGSRVRRVHVYGPAWDLLPESYEGVYEGADEGQSPP